MSTNDARRFGQHRLSARNQTKWFVATVIVLLMIALAPPAAIALDPQTEWVNRAAAQSHPDAEELSKYLIIGMGKGDSDTVNIQNAEEGADQEVVSTSNVGSPSQTVFKYTGGLSLYSTVVTNLGWTNVDPNHGSDTVGIPDRLIGPDPNNPVAPAVYEGVDHSGNIALTSDDGDFNTSNVDLWANIGIDCADAVGDCENGAANSDWIQSGVNNLSLGSGAGEGGVNNFDPTDLKAELIAWREHIDSLSAEATIERCENASAADNNGPSNPFPQGGDTSYCTKNGEVSNHAYNKTVGVPLVFDLDEIDTDDDGFAVIDVNVGEVEFKLNNTDWILRSTGQRTRAIFRINNSSSKAALLMSNATILYGDHTSDIPPRSMGAIFVKLNGAYSGNETFNLSNVILSGIAIWDLGNVTGSTIAAAGADGTATAGSVDDEGTSVINIQNGQGCAQFVGQSILHGSSNRWNRCAPVNACPGATIKATVCEDLNKDGFCQVAEPRFIPDHVDALDIPIELIPQSPTSGPILFEVTDNTGMATLVHPPDPFEVPGNFLLDVDDALLFSKGYVPTTTDVKPISVGACQIAQEEFGYVKTLLGGVGDWVWYDVNRNGEQDEWYDANDNGTVDKYIHGGGAAPLPFDEWEWIDINGDNNFDGDDDLGELNKCGIPGATVQMVDPASTATTNLLGYYRFWDLHLGRAYETKLIVDANLIAGAIRWFTVNNDGLVGNCVSIPALPTVTAAATVQQTAVPMKASAVEEATCFLTDGDERISFDLGGANPNIDLGLDYPIVCEGPLAVTLSDFKAERLGDSIHFSWTTATETSNAGFNLYAETADGLEKLNEALIASTVIDSVTPTAYNYEAQTNGNLFHIELVGIDEVSEMVGPFAAIDSGAVPQFTVDSALWIPMVAR